MSNLINQPPMAAQHTAAFLADERRRIAARSPMGIGGALARQRHPKLNQGFGIGQQATDLPRPPTGTDSEYADPQPGGTAPDQCGVCVTANNDCTYHPALFCGWSQLPWSTFKDQGTDAGVNTGPVTSAFGSEREIQITAERACFFRIRSIWFRSLNADDLSVGIALLSDVTINRNPWMLEIGSSNADERIGIPSSMFDDTFWTLPVSWGILDAIENRSRPLVLTFITPSATDQQVVGMLFGDPLDRCGRPKHGNTMLN